MGNEAAAVAAGSSRFGPAVVGRGFQMKKAAKASRPTAGKSHKRRRMCEPPIEEAKRA
jgi:hypothetical protein